jgi:hypothetical protein
MRCGRRFGKAFLRGGLGLGHLTEGRSRESARHEPAAEADREQRRPERAEQKREGSFRIAGTSPHDRWCADRRAALIADGRLARARVPTSVYAGARHRGPWARTSFRHRPSGGRSASRALTPDQIGPRCGSRMGPSRRARRRGRRPVRGMSMRRRSTMTAVRCRGPRNHTMGGHGRNRRLRLLLLLGGRGLLGRVPGR